MAISGFAGAVAAGVAVYFAVGPTAALIAFGAMVAAVVLGVWLGLRLIDSHVRLMNKPWRRER